MGVKYHHLGQRILTSLHVGIFRMYCRLLIYCLFYNINFANFLTSVRPVSNSLQRLSADELLSINDIILQT